MTKMAKNDSRGLKPILWKPLKVSMGYMRPAEQIRCPGHHAVSESCGNGCKETRLL